MSKHQARRGNRVMSQLRRKRSLGMAQFDNLGRRAQKNAKPYVYNVEHHGGLTVAFRETPRPRKKRSFQDALETAILKEAGAFAGTVEFDAGYFVGVESLKGEIDASKWSRWSKPRLRVDWDRGVAIIRCPSKMAHVVEHIAMCYGGILRIGDVHDGRRGWASKPVWK